MLTHDIMIALRNLKRFKGFSFLNIAGLSVGITCSIMLFLFVLDELSYDRFNTRAGQTYRVFVSMSINGKGSTNAQTAAPLGPALASTFPEVVTYTRVGAFGSRTFRYQDNTFKVGKIYTADSTFFDVFTLPFLEGNPHTALDRPNTTVITETAARRYFGRESPVGKVLKGDGGQDLVITGLMEDFPANSHFACDFLVSLATDPESRSHSWLDLNYTTYAVLRRDCDPRAVEEKLKSLVSDYVGPEAAVVLGVPASQFLAQGNTYALHLQPLTSVYLRSQREYGIDQNTAFRDFKSSDIVYVQVFLAVALFILLLAVINFINLTTARSERRAKEVGIRKTLGATRPLLIRQFLIEAILMSSISVVLAVGMIRLLLPFFNELTGKTLGFPLFNDFSTIPLLVSFVLLVGVLAGSYPAFYLSSFQPMHVLKSVGPKGGRKTVLRSVLVIAQFAISISFFIGTMVIRSQLEYIQTKNLGFNKEQLIIVNNAGLLGTKVDACKQELSRDPAVVSSCQTTQMFQAGIPGCGLLFEQRTGTDPILFQYVECDYEFLKTYQLTLHSGRFFSREFSTDTSAIVINEAGLKECGGIDPLNKEFTRIDLKESGGRTYKIIGVVKNFHYESLHQKIRPLAIYLKPAMIRASLLTVRVQAGDMKTTIRRIEETWKTFSGNEKFTYGFLDQNLARLYRSEQKTNVIATVFSCLAIFIACLGLFGLAAFVAEQRTKEIGIRKILGASTLEIVTVLSSRFAVWVLVSNAVAWPIAYIVMTRWLQNFAYRIDLSIWIFLVAGVIAMTIALLTVGYQTVKAAIVNPVHALRYE